MMPSRELYTILSNIGEGVVAIDKEKQLIFFNSAVISALPHAVPQPKKLSDLTDDVSLTSAFEEVLTSAQPLEREFASRGSHYRIKVRPLTQEDGAPLYGAVGIFHDISDIKKVEQMRIDFVANVSHELRTPLTSIKGFAATLADGYVQGEGTHFLERLRANVNRLNQLISDLLDLSIIESTEGDSDQQHWEVVDLAPLAAGVADSLRERAQQREQTLIVESSVSSPLWGEQKRLEQVVVNLLDNALKYTPTGGTITVSVNQVQDQVALKISDTGIGIPAEHLPRLFERFYRVDKARSRDLGGTGLGLAIVKHIVHAHGGKISVQSVIGKGTEFTVWLPLSSN